MSMEFIWRGFYVLVRAGPQVLARLVAKKKSECGEGQDVTRLTISTLFAWQLRLFQTRSLVLPGRPEPSVDHLTLPGRASFIYVGDHLFLALSPSS